MAGMKDPMFDPSLTVGIPENVVVLLKETVVAAQMFGSATGSRAATPVCQTRMDEQKSKVAELLAVLRAEFSRRYEAGLDVARNEAEADREELR